MEEKKKKRILFSAPGWTLVLFMAVFGELILHLWTNDPIVPGRLLAVLLYGIGFGGILALLTSLVPEKHQKWVAIVLSFLLVVMYLTWYFINESFKIFMTISTIRSGAQGVATGFLDTVIVLLARDWWRIALMLLPLIFFGVCVGSKPTTWKLRGIMAGAVVLVYCLALGTVYFVSHDNNLYQDAYNFNSAVHAFGLNTGLALDLFQTNQQEVTGFEIPATLPTEAEEAETEASEDGEEAIVYEPNVMDFDFEQLADTCGNTNIEKIHRYVAAQKPTLKNEYTGIFQGKNLIIISAEAFSAEVIDPDRTPTLYRMANNGFQFLDYYQPMWGGGTSGGEFANLMGFPGYGNCMKEARFQKFFLNMGYQLDKLGYVSGAYHNNDWKFYDRDLTHFYLGYDTYMGCGNGMEEGVKPVWPESDLEMFQFIMPQFLDSKDPFNLYFMSVSGHSLYNYKGNAMARKNWDVVKDLPYGEEVKCYLGANQELENAMAYLVNALEEKGIADDTVIVIGADHYPYGLEKSSTWGNSQEKLSELYGYPCTDDFVRDHNRLIIWSGCMEKPDFTLNRVVDAPTSSLDILPTVSNLFGVEFDSRLLVGRDVFSDAMPLVLWNNFNWKTEKGTYNPVEHIFQPAEGAEIEDGYVDYITTIVKNKLTYAKSVMDFDYFNVLLPKEEKPGQAAASGS